MFGNGTNLPSRFDEIELKSEVGMWPVGKIVQYGVPAGNTVPLSPRSANGDTLLPKGQAPGVAAEAEKSPVRCAGVNTVTTLLLPGSGWRLRFPWYDKKKKVLSLKIGPPKVPPNRFWWN